MKIEVQYNIFLFHKDQNCVIRGVYNLNEIEKKNSRIMGRRSHLSEDN